MTNFIFATFWEYDGNNLWIIITPNARILYINVPIQPRVSFITEPNFLVKIGIGGHLVVGPFIERITRLMVVLLLLLHELDFIGPQTKTLTLNFCEQWRMDPFESYSAAHILRCLWGCTLSTSINLVRKRFSVAQITDSAGRLFRANIRRSAQCVARPDPLFLS